MFKDKLKELRVKGGYTQANVAKAIGVSAATIGNYEQGIRTPKDNASWQALADFFSVSIDELMDNSQNRAAKIEQMKNLEIERIAPPSYIYSDRRKYFRSNCRIIYNNQDITDLVFSDTNTNGFQKTDFSVMCAYLEFSKRSGDIIYARNSLLGIIDSLREHSKDEIKKNLDKYVCDLRDRVVYSYCSCWSNLKNIFPEDPITDLDSFYRLLEKCLFVYDFAIKELYFSELPEDFSWLRPHLLH